MDSETEKEIQHHSKDKDSKRPKKDMSILKITEHLFVKVFDTGDIWTVERTVQKGKVWRLLPSRKLPQTNNGKNYLTIIVGGRKGFRRYVHRLVAEAFDKKYTPSKHVHHRDKNPLNNRSCNLVCLAPSEHFKEHPNKGLKLPYKEYLLVIDVWMKTKESTMFLSKKLNLSRDTISRVLRKKQYQEYYRKRREEGLPDWEYVAYSRTQKALRDSPTLVEAYLRGEPIQKICKDNGCNAKKIYAALKRAKVTLRGRNYPVNKGEEGE